MLLLECLSLDPGRMAVGEELKGRYIRYSFSKANRGGGRAASTLFVLMSSTPGYEQAPSACMV